MLYATNSVCDARNCEFVWKEKKKQKEEEKNKTSLSSALISPLLYYASIDYETLEFAEFKVFLFTFFLLLLLRSVLFAKQNWIEVKKKKWRAHRRKYSRSSFLPAISCSLLFVVLVAVTQLLLFIDIPCTVYT